MIAWRFRRPQLIFVWVLQRASCTEIDIRLLYSVVLILSLPIIGFAADGPNLVRNAGFDRDLSYWNPVLSNPVWTSFNGGSARLTVNLQPPNSPTDLRQCISGIIPGRTYRWGGRANIPAGQNRTGVAYMYLVWVSRLTAFNDCDGHVRVDFGGSTATVGSFQQINGPTVTAPPGAIGAQISFNVQKTETGGSYSVDVDDAYLIETNATPFISVSGPTGLVTRDPKTFTAEARNCTASATGWNWTATGGATISGGTTRTASIQWPSPGTFTVTATNSACGSASGSLSVGILGRGESHLYVASYPRGMLQVAGSAGATDSFSIVNGSDISLSVRLDKRASFYTLSSETFTMGPDETKIITITGTAQPAGSYRDSVGIGFTATGIIGLSAGIPVALLSVAPPTAPVQGQTPSTRVDVVGDPGTTSSGSISFTNSGSGTLRGLLVSNVPWLVPQTDPVTIPPGGTATASFTVDRTRRPDSDSPTGSVAGELALRYASGAAGGTATADSSHLSVSTTTVVVVDTAKATLTEVPIPPLAGEVALFIPGVGHVQGSVGLFLSDVSLLNTKPNAKATDVRMYYTPAGGAATSQSVTLSSFPAGLPVPFADMVKSLFGKSEVGTLQIRSRDLDDLGVSANVFNASNPAGTYGTALPVLRSDRAVSSGESTILTGVRADATTHTNLYIQETEGAAVNLRIDFYDAAGVSKGTRNESVAPFALLQIGRAVPDGAVSAILTNTGGSGRFLAFATPVDRSSGDTWSVTDWKQINGYAASEPVLIPIAGAVRGANNTYFRTDLAITNGGTASAAATLRYYPRGGSAVERTLTLPPLQSRVLADVVTTYFNFTTDSVGFIVITPAPNTRLAATSRTYTTAGSSAATFGTGVPTLAVAALLKAGDTQQIGNVDDAAIPTVVAAKPATFRTNFAIMDVTGAGATVRVTVRFTYSSGKVTAIGAASKDYALAPWELRLLPLTSDIFGAVRSSFGDFKNLHVEFAVTGGNGTVAVFVSSVDNGTGDSILRID